MSVIIKGMEMPKSCIECVIKHSFFRVLKCSKLKGMKGFKKLPHEHDRHPDCPLVALPEKHGRLIDEDEFKKSVESYSSVLPEERELIGVLLYNESAILESEE